MDAQQKRELSESFIDSFVFGLMLVDDQGEVISANRAIRKMFPTVTLKDISSHLGGTVNLAEQHNIVIKNGGNPYVHDVLVDDKSFKISIYPVISEQTKVKAIGSIIMMEDITQQKKSDEFMNSIIFIIAHEMRTPISIIKGNAELLSKMKSQKLSDIEVHKMVESLEKNSDQLLKLMDSFLNYEVLEEKKLKFNRVSFDLVELANEIGTNLGILAAEKNLYIKILTPKEPLPRITADPEKTREVLTNIFRNSLQYTDNGGMTVSFEKNGNFVKMIVSDTGRAIEPSEQNILFKKFHTAIRSGVEHKKLSSGLGLYISKFILESMGGSIWLEQSDPKKGTIFALNLPTRIINKTKMNMNEKPLILLVDDEEEILNVYGTALSHAGYEIVKATNGFEAIEVAKQKRPDLILMDVKMPQMNGIEAVLKLRQDPEMDKTKIVFITAFEDPRIGIDMKVAEVIGMIDVIKKGLSLDELVAKVQNYLASA